MSVTGKRTSLFGVLVNAIDLESTIAYLETKLKGSEKKYICLAPAHNLMACRADSILRNIFNRADLTVPDGMGTVWFLRALGHKAGRVYGPDLLLSACQRGLGAGWRHYFLGGTPEVVEQLAQRLKKEFASVHVAGFFSPPFREMEENEVLAMVDRINESNADIVWVGLGSPKQELWMAEFRDRLQAPVLIGVGAAFDFLAGSKPQAPKWMQNVGLEWFFRFLTEPQRLFSRYAKYPLFVILALAQILGITKYQTKTN